MAFDLVDKQLGDYERMIDHEDSRQDWIEAQAEELVGEWKRELEMTGLIVDMGWYWTDWRDLAEIEHPDLWAAGKHDEAMEITITDAAERDVENNIEALMEKGL